MEAEGIVRINPEEIPKVELTNLCRAFARAAKKYFEDPENMRKFEEWKKEQRRIERAKKKAEREAEQERMMLNEVQNESECKRERDGLET